MTLKARDGQLLKTPSGKLKECDGAACCGTPVECGCVYCTDGVTFYYATVTLAGIRAWTPAEIAAESYAGNPFFYTSGCGGGFFESPCAGEDRCAAYNREYGGLQREPGAFGNCQAIDESYTDFEACDDGPANVVVELSFSSGIIIGSPLQFSVVVGIRVLNIPGAVNVLADWQIDTPLNCNTIHEAITLNEWRGYKDGLSPESCYFPPCYLGEATATIDLQAALIPLTLFLTITTACASVQSTPITLTYDATEKAWLGTFTCTGIYDPDTFDYLDEEITFNVRWECTGTGFTTREFLLTLQSASDPFDLCLVTYSEPLTTVEPILWEATGTLFFDCCGCAAEAVSFEITE